MTASPQYLECEFPGRDARFVVRLLTSEAPASCRHLSDLLPIETGVYNSKWNGAELFVVLPPMQTQTTESPLGAPLTGDVALFQWGPTHRAAPKSLRAEGLGAYSELGFYYGSLIRAYSPEGPATGTRVGRIVEGLESLADIAGAMRRDGFGPIRLSARS